MSTISGIGLAPRLGLAHLYAHRYEEAIDWLDRALVQKPSFFAAMQVIAAACGHLGRLEEGREWVARLREIVPDFSVTKQNSFLTRFMVPEVVEIQLEGLRKAGLPEK